MSAGGPLVARRGHNNHYVTIAQRRMPRARLWLRLQVVGFGAGFCASKNRDKTIHRLPQDTCACARAAPWEGLQRVHAPRCLFYKAGLKSGSGCPGRSGWGGLCGGRRTYTRKFPSIFVFLGHAAKCESPAGSFYTRISLLKFFVCCFFYDALQRGESVAHA